MTKTTNYEISKKLAEIGFKAGNWAEYVWAKDEDGDIGCETKGVIGLRWGKHEELCESYDLETLLDALPEKIKVGIDRTPQSKFYFDKISFGYAKEPKIEFQFYCRIQESESLADTAGRLIILLESKNLIKF